MIQVARENTLEASLHVRLELNVLDRESVIELLKQDDENAMSSLCRHSRLGYSLFARRAVSWTHNQFKKSVSDSLTSLGKR